MKLQINRKAGNVRFGSRAWAASLPADGWTWEFAKYGDGSLRVEIHNRDLLVASLGGGFEDNGVEADWRKNLNYGGQHIGGALLQDLCDWINNNLDLEADDKGELIISSK